jgi:PAS domain S-box-containing protein
MKSRRRKPRKQTGPRAEARFAELSEEARRRQREGEALAEVARSLTESLDVAGVARRIVASVLRLFGARSSGIRLLRADGSLESVARSDHAGAHSDPGDVIPPGMGISRRAIAEDRPIRAANVLTEPGVVLPERLRQRVRAAGEISFMAAPLRVKGQTIGALTLADREGRVFTDDEAALLQVFADQAALALENAQLYEESKRRQSEAELIAALAREISGSLELDAVLERVAEGARELVGCDLATIALREPGSEDARIRYRNGWRYPLVEPLNIVPGRGLGGQVLATGRPFRTADYPRDPRLSKDYAHALTAEGIVATMAVPILIGGRAEGVLYAARREARPFTDRDEAALGRLATQASTAIANAQLFARERAARARAEASEQALRESEERFRSVVENASDLITVLTADGVIEYESPSLERLLGWRPEELIGKQLMDYVHPDDVTLLSEAIAKRLADPSTVNAPTEFRARARDGSWHVLAVTSRVSRSETGSVTLVATSRDVTERRLLEDQLRQAHRLESVGRLAGGVAHDFNNLLTVIGGRAHLLLSRLRRDDPSRRDVELIKKTGARAAELTQQLLAFSRRQVLQPKVLNLNDVVSSLESILHRLIGEHIELVTALAPGPLTIKADPGQLEQAVMNLALNARDAMPTGGRLSISTARATLGPPGRASVDTFESGSYVLLIVSDTGVGMDEATCSHVFEPFFTTKDVGQGTGLGLATVYGIVKQSGGHITAESEPGRGSAFTIYLPEVPGEAVGHAPSQTLADAPRGVETILLVEDEAEVRDLAREILELAGYRVLEAISPEEAERISRDETSPIHLLLTDVVMPRMSGRQLAERLTEERPDTRVLYMSGYTDDAIVHHGVPGQGTAFLSKPFTPADLARRVREVLDAAS